MARTPYWDQIATGMTVYDLNGEKLGKVRDIDPSGDYLHVEKGWLFVKDFYVPADMVSSMNADGIQLNLLKDQLNDARYDAPPVATAGSTGYGGADYSTGSMTDATAMSDTTGATDTTRTAYAQPGMSTNTTDQSDMRVPVYEEELVAGTRRQEQGNVRIHKDVVEEQQTVDVPLQRERVTVERVPYSGDANVTDDAFTGRDIDVPVMGEEAIATKRARGVEEVRVRKDMVTENQQVSDTVRKERVRVEGADVNDQDLTTGTGAGKFDTAKNRLIDDAGQMRDDAASTTDRTTDRWADR